jgi:hypothetical protein
MGFTERLPETQRAQHKDQRTDLSADDATSTSDELRTG